MRLIHISDPHLTSLADIPRRHFVGKRRLGYASWRWRRRRRHLRPWLDEVCTAAVSLEPDVIVVTGDLVHLGLPPEIEAAARWIKSLGPPERVFLVPGNHDLYREDSWAAVKTHWHDYLRLAPLETGEPAYWDGFPTRLRCDGVELHGLNTGLPTPVFLAAGELGRGQCDRLRERLAAAPHGTLHIVALHHPPVPGAMPERKALRDIHRLAPIMDQAHFALHGHGHFNLSYRLGAVPVFATGSASVADAAFRCFDIARENDGWRVEMSLESRSEDGFRRTETDSFAFPD